jgi:hypothetical protein
MEDNVFQDAIHSCYKNSDREALCFTENELGKTSALRRSHGGIKRRDDLILTSCLEVLAK